jgi:hypothetical protein
MSIAGGGLTRELGEWWNVELLDATSLDSGGYVLTYKVESSRNKVDKCGAADVPACVSFRSTRDPEDMNEHKTHLTLTGAEIGTKGIPVFREGWAKLKVADNNSAIKEGDAIAVASTGGGKVDKYTAGALTTTSASELAADVETRFNELANAVGNAEEKIPAGTTGAPGADKVLTKLSIRAIGIVT